MALLLLPIPVQKSIANLFRKIALLVTTLLRDSASIVQEVTIAQKEQLNQYSVLKVLMVHTWHPKQKIDAYPATLVNTVTLLELSGATSVLQDTTVLIKDRQSKHLVQLERLLPTQDPAGKTCAELAMLEATVMKWH